MINKELLRFLFVEDSETDAELERRELRQGGLTFESRRVEQKGDLERVLQEWKPDLVLSDFSMPRLSGNDALDIVRRQLPEVPFIFVSGTIGEERAIEAMKRGATDYVVKDRLGGLAIRVQRALDEAEGRKKRQKLEEELRHSRKMDALGRVAGAIAHDFNNILTAILSFGELALRKSQPDDAIHGDIQEIYNAAEMGVSLTRQLLSFGRKSPMVLRAVELNAAVSSMAKLLARLLGPSVAINLRLEPSVRPVRADVTGLEQILLNLAVNARDAMPNGGTLTIETLRGMESTTLLNVRDTGTGIDAETLPRIFEPFFTTKERGRGTGLGLATVYGLVQTFGGTISVASEMGRGTMFSICLQEALSPTGGAPATVSVVRPGLPTGTETILVAEDSAPIRTLLVQVLKAQGYQVLEAADGTEAVRLAEVHAGKIDLLVTDVVMPGLGGFELVAQLRVERSGLKVLVMSGLDPSHLEEYAVLPKPFTPIQLARRVRQVLDESG